MHKLTIEHRRLYESYKNLLDSKIISEDDKKVGLDKVYQRCIQAQEAGVIITQSAQELYHELQPDFKDYTLVEKGAYTIGLFLKQFTLSIFFIILINGFFYSTLPKIIRVTWVEIVTILIVFILLILFGVKLEDSKHGYSIFNIIMLALFIGSKFIFKTMSLLLTLDYKPTIIALFLIYTIGHVIFEFINPQTLKS